MTKSYKNVRITSIEYSFQTSDVVIYIFFVLPQIHHLLWHWVLILTNILTGLWCFTYLQPFFPKCRIIVKANSNQIQYLKHKSTNLKIWFMVCQNHPKYVLIVSVMCNFKQQIFDELVKYPSIPQIRYPWSNILTH